MREGQTRTGRSRELLDRATGAVEMQRVHENAKARPAGRLYDIDRGIEVWHDGPRKEFQHGLKSVSDSEVVDSGQPVGKSRQIRIIRCGDDISRIQLGPGHRNGSRPATSMTGVMRTNSISSTPTPVSAIADLVAHIILGSRMSA
jgi:hypothetical protein